MENRMASIWHLAKLSCHVLVPQQLFEPNLRSLLFYSKQDTKTETRPMTIILLWDMVAPMLNVSNASVVELTFLVLVPAVVVAVVPAVEVVVAAAAVLVTVAVVVAAVVVLMAASVVAAAVVVAAVVGAAVVVVAATVVVVEVVSAVVVAAVVVFNAAKSLSHKSP